MPKPELGAWILCNLGTGLEASVREFVARGRKYRLWRGT